MKKQKIKRRSTNSAASKSETSLDRTLKSSLWGLILTAGISLALLLAGAAAAFFTDDPTALTDPIGYVALFISAFFGGFACSKLNKRAPFLTSALTGAGFVLLSMLFSFALPHSLASGMNIWTRLLLHALSWLTFPIGAFAGMKGSKQSNPRKRKKR